MRVWVLLASVGLFAACDDAPPAGSLDAALTDSAVQTDPADLGAALSGRSCLDRPTALMRAPTGELPCELFPSGR